jgi:hypothetical protein
MPRPLRDWTELQRTMAYEHDIYFKKQQYLTMQMVF